MQPTGSGATQLRPLRPTTSPTPMRRSSQHDRPVTCVLVRWTRRFPQAVSHCDARQRAVALLSGARKAPVQQKLARGAVFARRCPPAAPVEKAASRSRDRRAVVRLPQRASGSPDRPQRPLHAPPASGPHPSAGASRASPRRALFEATCSPPDSPRFAATCLRYEMRPRGGLGRQPRRSGVQSGFPLASIQVSR